MWRLPICGGNWNNTSNAGLACLNLNNLRSNVSDNIGSRSALLGCKKSYSHGITVKASWKRSSTPPRNRGNIYRSQRLVGEIRMPLRPLVAV